MTEQEWLASNDVQRMYFLLDGQEVNADGHLTPLRVKGLILRRVSRRKAKLLACVFCRLVWPQLVDERSRNAVIVAEHFADGEATDEELHAADNPARDAWLEMGSSDFSSAAYLAWGGITIRAVARLIPASTLASVLRDVVCNPFRPLPPISRKQASVWRRKLESWLAWNGGTVAHLAQVAYDERALPSGELDRGRLAILADALEDSGCASADILDHLRGPGPHVCGCWVVDLLLGKG